MAKDLSDKSTLPLIPEGKKRGRPKSNDASRAEQLRLAQQKFREKQKIKLKELEGKPPVNWIDEENLKLHKALREAIETIDAQKIMIEQLKEKAEAYGKSFGFRAYIKKTSKYFDLNKKLSIGNKPFMVCFDGRERCFIPYDTVPEGTKLRLGDLELYNVAYEKLEEKPTKD